MIVENRGG